MAPAKKKALLAAGVDAGSAVTRCLILELDGDEIRYLGHGEHPSRGWVRGRLADPEAVSDSIRWAVRMAECVALTSLESAVIGLGGAGIDGGVSRFRYQVGKPRKLDATDVELAVRKASRVQLAEDRMLLQVLPQYFNVDGRTGYRKPVDMMAEVLEASVYLITASGQEHDCLVNALHSASLGVDETIAESTAAAYGSLLDGDRKEGAALIDIGAHSSDLAVYHGDSLLCAASLPIGGEHFTNDLCYGFKVAPEDAELLKLQYGCALVGMTSSSSLVEVPSPEGRPPREARRMDLNNVLQIRGEELFERAAAEIARAGLDRQLLGGVLLAGGAAKLPGLLDLAEKVLGCQARLALPIGIADLPETLDDPAWTTCAGLAMYGARLKLRQETQKRAPGLLGLMFR